MSFLKRAIERLPAALAALAVTLGSCLPSACTVPELRSIFFEASPAGKAASPQRVVRKPRHPPPEKPAEVVQLMEPDAPPPVDWRALFEGLPRASDGSVDWEQALSQKLVSLKPGVEPEAKQEDILDLDLEFVPKNQPQMKVVFPHKVHTQWLSCTNCHTAIFEMQRSAQPITMDQILAGEKCGYCHGKVAFVPTACPTCHVAMK